MTFNAMTPEATPPEAIVKFWRDAGPEMWFVKSDSFDEAINQNFAPLPEQANSGGLDHWMQNAASALALILVLDQFPRNLHRNSAKAWAHDDKARDYARKAIEEQYDETYEMPLKRFFYLPFMHSEKLEEQQYCLDLCQKAEDQEGVDFAQLHYDIIERFGRFPHRNEVLGRKSSTEELSFLADGGFHG